MARINTVTFVFTAEMDEKEFLQTVSAIEHVLDKDLNCIKGETYITELGGK